MTPRSYRITIDCDSSQPANGNRSVVGVFLSAAWFRVLGYWLTQQLGAEGLVVQEIDLEEIVYLTPEETDEPQTSNSDSGDAAGHEDRSRQH